MAKKGQVSQTWHLIDATDQVVGRLAVQIATILRGKHRPEYTPHIDTGDYVIVMLPNMDPPALIPEFFERARSDADIVYGVRLHRKSEPLWYRAGASGINCLHLG